MRSNLNTVSSSRWIFRCLSVRYIFVFGFLISFFDVTAQKIIFPDSTTNVEKQYVVCDSTVWLKARNPGGGSGIWKFTSNSMVTFLTSETSDSVKVLLLKPGPAEIYWKFTSTDNKVTIPPSIYLNNAYPSKPTIVNNQNRQICEDTILLTAKSPTNGTGKWSSKTVEFIPSASSLNVTAKKLPKDQSVIYWEVSTGNQCPSRKDSIIVNSYPTTKSFAGISRPVCTDTVYLRGNPTNPNDPLETGRWSGSLGIIENANSYITTVKSLKPGSNTFSWQISNNNDCESRSTVTITYNKPSTATITKKSDSTCFNQFKLKAVPAPGGKWSVIPGKGSGSFSNINTDTTTVTGLSSGINWFKWTVVNPSCGSSVDSVRIKYIYKPTPVVDKEFCAIYSQNTSIKLQLKFPITEQGLWSAYDIGIPQLITDTSNAAIFTPTQPKAFTFSFQLKDNICKQAAVFTKFYVLTKPSLPSDRCIPTTNNTVVTDSIMPLISPVGTEGRGSWGLEESTPLLSNPNLIKGPGGKLIFAKFPPGVYKFKYSITDSLCIDCKTKCSNSAFITVTIFNKATIKKSVLNCTTDPSFHLSANKLAAGEKGSWLNGNATFVPTPNSDTILVQNLKVGKYKVYWKVDHSNGCQSQDSTTLYKVTKPFAGVDICASTPLLDSITITGTKPDSTAGETANWNFTRNPNDSYIYPYINTSKSSNKITIRKENNPGNYILWYIIKPDDKTNPNACPNLKGDTVNITLVTRPDTIATTRRSLPLSQPIVLKSNVFKSPSDTMNWIDPLNKITPGNTLTIPQNTSAGLYFYKFVIKNKFNNCRDSTLARVRILSSPKISIISGSKCITSSFRLGADPVVGDESFKWTKKDTNNIITLASGNAPNEIQVSPSINNFGKATVYYTVSTPLGFLAKDSIILTKITTPVAQLDNKCFIGTSGVLPKNIKLQTYEKAFWKNKVTNKLDSTIKINYGKQADSIYNLRSGQQSLNFIITDPSTGCSDTSRTSVIIQTVNKAKISPSTDTCISSHQIKVKTVKGVADIVLWNSVSTLKPLTKDSITFPKTESTYIFLNTKESKVTLKLRALDTTCFSKDSIIVTTVTQAVPMDTICLKGTKSSWLDGNYTATNPPERYKWYSLGKNNDTIFKSAQIKVNDSVLFQGVNKLVWEISYKSPTTQKVCISRSIKTIVVVPNAQYKPLDTCFVKTLADMVISVKTLNDTSNLKVFWQNDLSYPLDLIAKKDSLYNFTLKETGLRNYSWNVASKSFPTCATSSGLKFTVIPKASAGTDTCLKVQNMFTLKGSSVNTTKGEKGTWTSFPKSTFADSSSNRTTVFLSRKGKTGFEWLVSNNNCQDADSAFATYISKANIINNDNCLYFTEGIDLKLNNRTIDSVNESGKWNSKTTVINKLNASSASAELSKGLNIIKYRVFATQDSTCSDIDSVKLATFSVSSFQNIQDTLFTCTRDTSIIISPKYSQDSVYFNLSNGQKLIPKKDTIFLKNLSNDTTYSVYRTVRNKFWPSCFLKDSFNILNRQVDSVNFGPLPVSTCLEKIVVNVKRPYSDIATAKGEWIKPYIEPSGNQIFIDTLANNSTLDQIAFEISRIYSPGTYTLQWKTYNKGCKPLISNLIIDKKQNLVSKARNFSVCNADKFAFSALDSTDVLKNPESVIWKAGEGSGTINLPNSKDKNTVVANGISVGSNNFIYQATLNGCQANTFIVVTNNKKFKLDSTIRNRTFSYCEKDTAAIIFTHPLLQPSGDFKINFSNSFTNNIKYDDGDTNHIIKTPLQKDVTILNLRNLNLFLKNKSKKIYVMAINGSCPSQYDSITIKNSLKPDTIFAGQDDTLCNSNVSLKGFTNDYAKGIWSVINGANKINEPSKALTTAKAIRDSLNIFQWTVTNGACKDSARVKYLIGDSLSTAKVDANFLRICDSSNIHLKAVKPIFGKSLWLLNQSAISDTNNSNFPFATNNLKDNDKVNFIWKVFNKYCSNTDTMKLTLFKAPTTAVAGQSQSIVKEDYTLQANKPNIGIGKWEVLKGTAEIEDKANPNSMVKELSFGENVLKWTISNGICPASSDIIIIKYSDFNIPSGFSPNGDNKNDYFEIKGIESYPGTQLKIFNRWGMLVYSSENYQNQWDGDGLSDDTYYYELKITGSKEKHGYILMKRK